MDELRNFDEFNDWDDSREIKIQCLSWNGDNEFIENEQHSSEKRTIYNLEHTIKIYGVNEFGNSVAINIIHFKPYFYIKVPDDCSVKDKNEILRKIKEDMKPFIADGILSAEFVKQKEFYGFTNKKDYLFIKFTFLNLLSMKKCESVIREGIAFGKELRKYPLYESNILPFMRFMHEKNLEAAGWIKIPPFKYTMFEGTEKRSNCQIDIQTEWENVEFYQNKNLAPFLIASYDIECNSSHGDFPMAKKNYKKLGYETFDAYKNAQKNTSTKNFTQEAKRECLKAILWKAFSENNKLDKSDVYDEGKLKNVKFNHYDVSLVYTKGDEKPFKDVYSLLSRKLLYVIDRRETYKIMALDIIRNLESGITKYDSERQIKDKVKDLIEDAFSDDFTKKRFGSAVQTIYTKVNKKPNKRVILEVAGKIAKNVKALFKRIKMVLEIDDSDINYILSMFSKLESQSRDKITQKIMSVYEIEDKDAKILVTHIQQCLNAVLSITEDEFPDIDDSRVTYCKRITEILDAGLPAVEGDRVVQIGTTVQRFGETGCFLKHMITLKGCAPIEGAIVESYETEEEVLLAWTRFIGELDPDFITGYNIFGFDFSFMWERAEELGIVDEFALLGRERHQPKNADGKRQKEWVSKPSELVIKKLSSSALGDNVLKYISMEGRVVVDLLKVVQKDFNLVSYKLDYVAETFIKDKIKNITGSRLTVNGIQTLAKGNYITINIGKDTNYKDKKFQITAYSREENWIEIDENISDTDAETIMAKGPKWTLAKDDVSPKEIFELQDGSDNDRKKVAVYCIQDCALCITLLEKLKLITNNIGMANVCFVPISFLFLRGQGIKIFSLVSKECRDAGHLIPVIKHSNEEEKLTKEYLKNDKFEYGEDEQLPPPANDGGYEGAIVLDPKPGIYLDTPVTVLDYSSLYPSSMISENLSHDSYVMEENPENKQYLGDEGIERLEKMGYGVVDREYDVYEWIDPRKRSKGKRKVGKKTCRFVQPADGSKSIIPNILRKLLKARKSTRKLIVFQTITLDDDTQISGLYSCKEEDGVEIVSITDKEGKTHRVEKSRVVSQKSTYTEFEQAVFDGLQLAYKLTANSLYGQIGAQTSPIYMKDIAASTTATGRMLLYLAKEKVEEQFEGAEIVYGDTDSIFINFNPKKKGREGLKESIDLGIQAEEYIQQFLKAPHKLEYEKTFWPFILFSKKRYIGNKYEFKTGENDYKTTSMGIVLKRRDNAEIVKHVYGGVIDILMNQKNVELSIEYLKKELTKLLDGKFPLDMLVITKSLRGFYKNPEQIAHKVLADRIGIRDPGNKPKSNDRIPYVYIEKKGEIKLQGDRIETPEYIRDNKLKPDYMFYITNQIMKPVAQIYSLIVEDLEGYKWGPNYYSNKYNTLLATKTPEKARDKITSMKFDDTCDIIFGDIIRVANNRKTKSKEITDFFKVTK